MAFFENLLFFDRSKMKPSTSHKYRLERSDFFFESGFAIIWWLIRTIFMAIYFVENERMTLKLLSFSIGKNGRSRNYKICEFWIFYPFFDLAFFLNLPFFLEDEKFRLTVWIYSNRWLLIYFEWCEFKLTDEYIKGILWQKILWNIFNGIFIK